MVDRNACERAGKLTESALSLPARPDGTVSDEAARLHLLAAELKRLNGAQRDVAVDYIPLARYFLASREIGTAIAYMRKALHVADLAGDRTGRMAAKLLAAEVYVAAEQGVKGRELAAEAASLAHDLKDGVSQAKAERLMEASTKCSASRSLRYCPCGKRAPYLQCCGLADEMPGEYLVKVFRKGSTLAASPYLSRGAWGLDLLMMPPETGHEELRTFYSWRIEDGAHRLLAYPNWTARALASARKMVQFAEIDVHGTEAPASAILQAACALEAFETAWKLFHKQDSGHPALPQNRPKKDFTEKSRIADSLNSLSVETFGEAWTREAGDKADTAALFELRNALVHSVGDAEQISPEARDPNEHVRYLLGRGLNLRPAPAPWADRVLTPSVARWALEVATKHVTDVRFAYASLVRKEAADEVSDGILQDIEEENSVLARE
ncbi:hypothetical protein [Methylobacterium sp. V23]|uniref:hypothetical protein n=1 Tax=Methylobacterium sp. V23 TaxID=2044878 RepID=UPI000CDB5090|nr:hypothetical protein [Methylobacterium sp. V23]POR41097.1 hypothetical protein CRT23_20250 [Methylobacterium sp. V23]